ncbi:MAG: hypothetical protein PUC47_02625, partial [Oscillospiraceae bacterium]|nr:hypothetical protein [Oscillospiraceae bacterium]
RRTLSPGNGGLTGGPFPARSCTGAFRFARPRGFSPAILSLHAAQQRTFPVSSLFFITLAYLSGFVKRKKRV